MVACIKSSRKYKRFLKKKKQRKTIQTYMRSLMVWQIEFLSPTLHSLP